MIPGVPDISQAAQALSNLTLVSPLINVGYLPQDVNGNVLGPALKFIYEGENTADMDSEITSHFMEDNSSVQDNIALKPEVFTVHGFMGEVNNVTESLILPGSVPQAVLTFISGFAPPFSTYAQNVINEANQAYMEAANAVNGAVQAWNSLNGEGGPTIISGGGIVTTNPTQNKQQAMFAQFYGYWRSRTLFAIQTPWAIFVPCAISKLRAVQDETTQTMTDFFVTFQLMRFASTINSSQVSVGRAAQQASPLSNNGVLTPTPSISIDQQFSNEGFTF